MSLKLPNLIIGGSPKCGTTSLFAWLKDHPEVCASSIKETGFLLDKVFGYSKDANYVTHGLEKYSTFFKHHKEEPFLMEATPEYLIQKTIPFEAFKKFDEIPKVVFAIRKPSDRIFSSYNFDRDSQQIIPSDMTFEEYLNADIGKKIKQITRYAEYLERWRNMIGEENVYVIIFDDLKKKPEKVMTDLSDFIGLSSNFWTDYNFYPKNKTQSIKNLSLHKRILGVNKYLPSFIKNSFIKRWYYSANKQKKTELTSVELKRNQELKIELTKEFSGELSKLENMLKVDLSAWN